MKLKRQGSRGRILQIKTMFAQRTWHVEELNGKYAHIIR